MALSGGVDSAVAAALLKQEGHNISAVYVRTWEYEDDILGDCPGALDLKDAKEISENYNTLDEKFIDTSKIKNRHEYELEKFSSIMEERRSNRTWCEIQPSSAEFQDLVNRLISYAAHMPYLCLF